MTTIGTLFVLTILIITYMGARQHYAEYKARKWLKFHTCQLRWNGYAFAGSPLPKIHYSQDRSITLVVIMDNTHGALFEIDRVFLQLDHDVQEAVSWQALQDNGINGVNIRFHTRTS